MTPLLKKSVTIVVTSTAGTAAPLWSDRVVAQDWGAGRGLTQDGSPVAYTLGTVVQVPGLSLHIVAALGGLAKLLVPLRGDHSQP